MKHGHGVLKPTKFEEALILAYGPLMETWNPLLNHGGSIDDILAREMMDLGTLIMDYLDNVLE